MNSRIVSKQVGLTVMKSIWYIRCFLSAHDWLNKLRYRFSPKPQLPIRSPPANLRWQEVTELNQYLNNIARNVTNVVCAIILPPLTQDEIWPGKRMLSQWWNSGLRYRMLMASVSLLATLIYYHVWSHFDDATIWVATYDYCIYRAAEKVYWAVNA